MSGGPGDPFLASSGALCQPTENYSMKVGLSLRLLTLLTRRDRFLTSRIPCLSQELKETIFWAWAPAAALYSSLRSKYYGMKVGLRGAGLSLRPLTLLTRRDRLWGLIACNEIHPGSNLLLTLHCTAPPIQQSTKRSTAVANTLGSSVWSTRCTVIEVHCVAFDE